MKLQVVFIVIMAPTVLLNGLFHVQILSEAKVRAGAKEWIGVDLVMEMMANDHNSIWKPVPIQKTILKRSDSLG